MNHGIITLLEQYLSVGTLNSNSDEVNRQIRVINLFAAVGFSLTSVLSINALFNDNHTLFLCLLVSSVCYLLSQRLVTVTGNIRGPRLAGNFLLYNLIILMLYLVYSGGNSNTGPLWIYLVPPVALSLCGLKIGMFNILIFTLMVTFLMFFDDGELVTTSYSYEFKTRLLYSFSTLTFLSAYYEYTRRKGYLKLQQLSDKFERQARQDSLTQLPNRRALREQLEYERSRSQRNKQPMALLMADIDHFKRINDTYGHDGGDYILKQITQLFRSDIRKQDVVGRWGGEEFLFILPDTCAEDAYFLGEKIRKAISNHSVIYEHAEIKVTISLGAAEVETQTNIDKAISEADHFLYQAKEQGRNMTLPVPREAKSS